MSGCENQRGLCLPGGEGSLLETQKPSERVNSQNLIHSFLAPAERGWIRETGVMWRQTVLFDSEERAIGIAVRGPVLSLSPTLPTDAVFPGSSRAPAQLLVPQPLSSHPAEQSSVYGQLGFWIQTLLQGSQGGRNWVVWLQGGSIFLLICPTNIIIFVQSPLFIWSNLGPFGFH